MPNKKKNASAKSGAGNGGGGAPINKGQPNGNITRKKKKHADPYAEATGLSIEEIVKSIEEVPAKVVKSGHGALAGDVAPDPDSAKVKGTEGSAPPQSQRANKKTSGKKRVVVAGPPPKKGMTKAQRREEQLRRREHPKERPLPNPNDFEEEEEESNHGSNNEDYSDTQNERAKEYRKGGYHPVVIGDVYNERYRVVKKLGWGYFSTVWLVWDYQTNTFQAMKIQKSAEHYREAAYDEIRLLSEIMSADEQRDRCCTRMNDFFEHVGPNGTHVCMVFDVLGENLLSLIEWYEYRGIPLPIIKAIAQQVLIGLEHIHSIDVLHTDLKPENVLLSTPKHKILSIMKRYTAPPLHKRPALVTKDVKSMTKSQRRRYYQKLKKDGGKTPPTGAALTTKASTGESDAEEDVDAPSTSDVPTGKASSGNEKHRNAAPSTGEQFGVPAEDTFSEPDPEWEVERFHHVCLADFGNSCWTYKQFTDEVQTRQYRSPEVILGNGYSTPLDLWSAACMFFELITGEFLFDPKQGEDYTRDEDHLALMSELLGELPEHMRLGNGKYRSQFYNSKGKLRHIEQLNFWGLSQILHEKYHFTQKKASEIAEFLLPMLAHDPSERATATEMLNNFQHFFEVQDDDYAPFCYVSKDSDDDAVRDDRSGGDRDGEDADHSDRDGGDVDSDSDEPRHASRAQESELRAWWSNHPLLNEASLEERNLTIKEVQMALAGHSLDTTEKQDEVEKLLVELEEMELAGENEN